MSHLLCPQISHRGPPKSSKLSWASTLVTDPPQPMRLAAVHHVWSVLKDRSRACSPCSHLLAWQSPRSPCRQILDTVRDADGRSEAKQGATVLGNRPCANAMRTSAEFWLAELGKQRIVSIGFRSEEASGVSQKVWSMEAKVSMLMSGLRT